MTQIWTILDLNWITVCTNLDHASLDLCQDQVQNTLRPEVDLMLIPDHLYPKTGFWSGRQLCCLKAGQTQTHQNPQTSDPQNQSSFTLTSSCSQIWTESSRASAMRSSQSQDLDRDQDRDQAWTLSQRNLDLPSARNTKRP
ncbi:hypothetical protein LDENG_00055310 [Lucifuga dentata]|nr:hypothetical protein LDENG_00055310 [Lucifuga dentata]